MSTVSGPKSYVLVVDDQVEILDVIKHILLDEGYEVVCVSDSRKIVESIRMRQPDMILLDVWLNDSRFDGVAVFDIIQQYYKDVPVVMISGHSSVSTAVEALKMGVFDFITKPFSTDQLISVVRRALEVRRLKRDYELLQSKTTLDLCFDTQAASWQAVQKNLLKASEGRSRVFIQGDTGCGKQYAAQFLHKNSLYATGPFVTFDAAVFVGNPAEALRELVGEEIHHQNSRSSVHIGVLERAARGTLYVSNIDFLDKSLQEALLSVLQDRRFMRQGGSDHVPFEARFISSTSRNIDRLVSKGLFLSGLYDRISIVHLQLPPLREFGGDIVKLMKAFICYYLQRTVQVDFDRAASFSIESYDWPGNLREVANVAEWLAMIVPVTDNHLVVNTNILGARLGATSLGDEKPAWQDGGFDITRALAYSMRVAREYFEQYYLEFHLKRNNRNYSRTAEVVGMERTALHRKMRQLGKDKETKAT